MIEEASDIDIRRVDRKSAPLLVFNKGYISMGFPDSSVGKESTCNAGDPSSTPGSGRSAGEGKGYPLQYSWASLVAEVVKNWPASPWAHKSRTQLRDFHFTLRV